MEAYPSEPKDWPHHAVVRSSAEVSDAQIWCTRNVARPHMSYHPNGFREGPCFCFVELASAEALIARFGGRILTSLEKQEIEAVDAAKAPPVPDLRAYYKTVDELEEDLRRNAESPSFQVIVEDATALGLVSYRPGAIVPDVKPLKDLARRCGRMLSGPYFGPLGESYYLCDLPTKLREGTAAGEEAFEHAHGCVLEEICMEGYLDSRRPEDEVAFLMDDNSVDNLTPEQRRLYEERLVPLMRIWFFNPLSFDEEYARLRATWLQS